MASIEKFGDRLIVVRCERAASLGCMEINDAMRTCVDLFDGAQSDLLIVLPADVELRIDALYGDRYDASELSRRIGSMAVVVEEAARASLIRDLLVAFPRSFAAEVFLDRAEAMRWLSGQKAVRA